MNREIKFRAKVNGGYVYSDSYVNLAFYFDAVHGYEQEQFTGLQDKNGEEVYEGDVLLFDSEKIVVSYGIQAVDAFEGIGFNLWGHYGEKQDGKRLQSEIEIIGNIYENPELLKG